MNVPKQVIFELTTHCNYNCDFCYCLWHENEMDFAPELDFSQWCEVASEFIDRGASNIELSGGEALLFPRLKELIDFILDRKNPPQVGVFTNGSLLDEDFLQFAAGRINLTVSLPGIKSYTAQTGSKNSYRQILAAILRGGELGCQIDLSCTITNKSYFEAEQLLKLALFCDVECCAMGIFMQAGRGLQHPELALSADKVLCLQQLVGKYQEKYPEKFYFSNEPYCYCNNGESRPADCMAGKQYLVVGPDGFVRSCLHHKIKFLRWNELDKLSELPMWQYFNS